MADRRLDRPALLIPASAVNPETRLKPLMDTRCRCCSRLSGRRDRCQLQRLRRPLCAPTMSIPCDRYRFAKSIVEERHAQPADDRGRRRPTARNVAVDPDRHRTLFPRRSVVAVTVVHPGSQTFHPERAYSRDLRGLPPGRRRAASGRCERDTAKSGHWSIRLRRASNTHCLDTGRRGAEDVRYIPAV